MTQVLVVGETWFSQSTHIKGFDQFETTTFHSGVEPLRDALTGHGATVTHMPAHEAASAFPDSLEELSAYDVVILSDVGADTLLLRPETWLQGRPSVNRLALMRDWVLAGGGLAMAGGYLSFQGIGGRARYRGTPIEQVLPCTLDPWDDRVEVPEGFAAEPTAPAHPIVAGETAPWPLLLGYNRVHLREDATLLAGHGDDALLAVREPGQGRTLAWTSDVGPHWCPEEFLAWPGYAALWGRAVDWLAKRI